MGYLYKEGWMSVFGIFYKEVEEIEVIEVNKKSWFDLVLIT